MIRIERMSLRLPAGAGDPRAAAHEATERIARALARSTVTAERLRIVVAPGEDISAATERALRDAQRGGG